MDYENRPGRPVDFEFRGQTGEWFGIWMTNLLLSILTIGIYSAWAKVRAKKYFYQNTYVAGRNFDYHATGLQILIGRIIVIVGLVVISFVSAIPVVGLFILLALLLLVPWLLVRALKFNAVMSSWANVRFGFDGSSMGAFLTFLLYPILAALTLYAAFPFADRARRRYVMNNHRLGAAPFGFDAPIGGFYMAFLAAMGWVVLLAILTLAPMVGTLLANIGDPTAFERDPQMAIRLMVGIYAFIFLGLLPAGVIYNAFIRNTVFNGTTLDGRHRFHSDVRPMALIWIAVTNALAVVLTLGLMLPWAQIRLARYYAAHSRLIPGGSLDEFVGTLPARTSALGDAYADIEGIDIGLPV
jgi:uncharacterized membrane protein YjgN (DUF898 family)